MPPSTSRTLRPCLSLRLDNPAWRAWLVGTEPVIGRNRAASLSQTRLGESWRRMPGSIRRLVQIRSPDRRAPTGFGGDPLRSAFLQNGLVNQTSRGFAARFPPPSRVAALAASLVYWRWLVRAPAGTCGSVAQGQSSRLIIDGSEVRILPLLPTRGELRRKPRLYRGFLVRIACQRRAFRLYSPLD